MGTKERKARQKEELRRSILTAANTLFLEEGYDRTTMRKIADAIEYNVATIYSYYQNKEEIFYALQKQAFESFYITFGKIFQENPHLSASERLIKMGRAYIKFAIENQAYYDLMFIMREPMEGAISCGDENWKIGEQNFELLRMTIKEGMESGEIPQGDLDTMALMIWSNVHGLASLYIRGRMKMFDDADTDFLIRNAVSMAHDMILGKLHKS